ncbi:AraC family transcriptional regulator [Nitrospirillum sp. BR 11163]|uniref:AraC family transcriptional regulator n=1 Tax=Nitrospirillum sp. BR 11163 TaxID=3104323 RepID=UPI002AFF6CBB|nr:AraC family transcriptional regulator [Nitrospirillum sp. BR 11163]MEA1676574.1 AraC family transcriptional regulator [Nitrospirillum sp. BR 11163]
MATDHADTETASLPLSNHLSLNTSKADEAVAFVESRLSVTALRGPSSTAAGHTRISHCHLPGSDLWYCAYGFPVTLGFPEGAYLRLQIPWTGRGLTSTNGSDVALAPTMACVSSADAKIDFHQGFQQFAWRVPIAGLTRKLASLTGEAISGPLRFEAALDLRAPKGRALKEIFSSLASAANNLPGPGGRLVLTELEQALTTALLVTGVHSHRHILEGPVQGIAPWQVRRAEDFIQAHAEEPLTIEDIVAVTGASARSVFRAFAQCRGYSPMEFVKRTRLQKARRLAESGQPALTVTDIALSCGYGDLSRFSKDFLNAFGEPPSTVLRRHRGPAGR